MKTKSFTAVFSILALLALAAGAPAFAHPQAAPKPVDMAKIMAEIAGTYDFDAQGQALVINFYVQEGKLFGMPEGETAEMLMPMKGDNPLMFDVTTADNGQYYELEFGRDEKGQIDKCTLRTQGMEVIGKKRAKMS
jgi:hypothetical protein